MPFLLAVACVALPQSAPPSIPVSGLGQPVVSVKGRVACSIADDLWVLERWDAADADADAWRRVTRHAAADRDPAWSADGQTLYFASNRAGSFDIYRLTLPDGTPERITRSTQPDRSPTVAPDGTIAFTRGRRQISRLMLRDRAGAERRATDADVGEHAPRFAPDGARIAYITSQKRGRQLRLLTLGESEAKARSRPLVEDHRCEFPAWSPDGRQILFSVRGRTPGLYVTNPEATYQNLVSRARVAAAFSADGERLICAGLPRLPPGYNGDPEPPVERVIAARRAVDRALWTMRAPVAPDTDRRASAARPPFDPGARFAALCDRLAAAYREPDRGPFLALAHKLRPQARAVRSPEELDAIVAELLAQRPPLRREVVGRAAVSSAHPAATAAGVAILEKGGNVVDAAIAISFALGVVEPDASGIGGYGEMLIHLEGMAEPTCIEFMTRVPGGIAAVKPGGSRRLSGPERVNVPGVVAGMDLAFRRHRGGTLTWQELLQPAIELARSGFTVDQAFTTTLIRNRERFLASKGAAALFFPDGRPLAAGDRLENPGLAWTLEEIPTNGASAFYKGAIAEKILADLRAHGSVMCENDLANYFAATRTPIHGTYRGHSVYSGAPPVTGGASLLGKLTLLEQHAGPSPQTPAPFTSDPATLHAMIEAWKLAPRTSGRIADPSLWPVDVAPFSDKAAAAKCWKAAFRADASLTPERIAELRKQKIAAAGAVDGILDRRRLTGTTAFAVADGRGNMVAVTQTLGTWGGNFHVTPGLGFLYNDKLRPMSSDPSRFGATVPNGRVGTVIAPTLLFRGTGPDKEPLAALGAAGNSWITSAVYQMVTGIVDHKLSPQRAIELPRFLVGGRRRRPGSPGEIVVQFEDGFAPDVLATLEKLGHGVQRISLRGELRMGYAAAVLVQDGQVRAGADPRRSGAAGAAR